MLVALKYFSVWCTFDCVFNGVWKVLMDVVTLNKQKSAIKLPDKKFFVAASLKFGKVGQNFVKAKHAGCTHLQHSLTVFFAK